MKHQLIDLGILLLLFAGVSCQNTPENEYSFAIKDLTNQEYPDNPDIGYMMPDYDYAYLKNGTISQEKDGNFSVSFYAAENKADSITVPNLDLMEFMPCVPKPLKQDAYLSYLAVVNQEWNRNQVQFDNDQFRTSNPEIVRVDIARNCLNAYLWEVILYKQKNGQQLPFSHGWFNFPKPLYANLFAKRNQVDFATYQAPLEDWVDPESKVIDKAYLPKLIDTVAVTFQDRSDDMYPLKGERKRKFREIIYPKTFATMRDLQRDSTLFATFSPAGVYDKADPRKTELGRLKNLKNIALYQTAGSTPADTLYEIDLTFLDANKSRTTKLMLGGLDLSALPTLADDDANDGWKNSMGFSNHTFYETYRQHEAWHANENPYFAYFTDGPGRWLDSHKIGVDGPLLYRDITNPNRIHVWLLSFERHAFVGHYVVEVK